MATFSAIYRISIKMKSDKKQKVFAAAVAGSASG